jgi:WD40 repeat protein
VTSVAYNQFAVPDVPTLATIGEKRIFFWSFRLEGERTRDQSWVLSKALADYNGKREKSMSSGLFLGPDVLVTGSYDGEMYIWDRTKLVDIIKAHSGPIFEIKLNMREKSFITCSSDGLAKIWLTKPGATLQEIAEVLVVSAVLTHVSIMDDSRQSLGYLMLKPHETLEDARKLIQNSSKSEVFIDHRIREITEGGNLKFLFVTGETESAMYRTVCETDSLAF